MNHSARFDTYVKKLYCSLNMSNSEWWSFYNYLISVTYYYEPFQFYFNVFFFSSITGFRKDSEE